jgi:hypothetical protein
MAPNEVLDTRWAETVWRLRVGIEPVDALHDRGPLGGVALHLESVPLPSPVPGPDVSLDAADGAGLPGVRANRAGRFALAFGQPLVDAPGARVVVRLVDPARRWVPRRLSIPVPTLHDVVDAEQAHESNPALPLAPRACRPALFPGAAYGEAAGATIVRGRVRWADGSPARWVRVLARTKDSVNIVDGDGNVIGSEQPMVGRAHGDDRGEFLLVIGPLPKELATAKSPTVDLSIEVRGRPEPAPNLPVTSPTSSRADPLWQLPVELIGALTPADPVALGSVLPDGYTAVATLDLTCRRGRVTRPSVPFVVT